MNFVLTPAENNNKANMRSWPTAAAAAPQLYTPVKREIQ
jgi:hypothetical protein